jgi:hypothetical protein
MMTIPLIVLGTASIVAGLLFNPAALKLFSPKFDFLPMEHWLEPVFAPGAVAVAEASGKPEAIEAAEAAKHHLEMISLGAALAAFLIGTGIAYWMYVSNKGKSEGAYLAKAIPAVAGAGGVVMIAVGGLWMALAGEFLAPRMFIPIALVLGGVYCTWQFAKVRAVGLDYAYDKSFVNGADALSDTAASIDQGFIDFIIARLTSLIVAALGTLLRIVQNGVVHVYAAMMVVGLAALGWFFVWPHADVSVAANDTTGDYTLTAAAGMGYGYRWYPQVGGEPNTKAFTGTDNIKVHLDEGQSRTVRLQVRNAFGREADKDVVISRPKPEKPPPGMNQILGQLGGQ